MTTHDTEIEDLRISPLVTPKASDMLSDWQIRCTLEMNDIPSIESMLVDEIGFNYTRHVPHGSARTSDHDGSRFQELLDEHPDDPNRACRRWIEETVTLEPPEYADVARAIHPFDVLDLLAKAEAEAARLRKLFDDAGEGDYDVLGLIDHYQQIGLEDHRAMKKAVEMLSAVGLYVEGSTGDMEPERTERIASDIVRVIDLLVGREVVSASESNRSEIEKRDVTIAALEMRVVAALDLLGETGCHCECEPHPDEHGDGCERCLGCRVEAILNPPGKP